MFGKHEAVFQAFSEIYGTEVRTSIFQINY